MYYPTNMYAVDSLQEINFLQQFFKIYNYSLFKLNFVNFNTYTTGLF